MLITGETIVFCISHLCGYNIFLRTTKVHQELSSPTFPKFCLFLLFNGKVIVIFYYSRNREGAVSVSASFIFRQPHLVESRVHLLKAQTFWQHFCNCRYIRDGVPLTLSSRCWFPNVRQSHGQGCWTHGVFTTPVEPLAKGMVQQYVEVI